MSFKATAALIGAFATTALAHGTVTGFKTDGTPQEGYKLDYYYAKLNGQTVPDIPAWSAENLDNGFVAPDAYGTSDIICHIKAEPGATTASVKAGGTVDFNWSAWPESHVGPVLTYVAKCDGECSAADKTTLKWVKIDEAGINLDTQVWAATDMIANNNTWTTTVPSTLAAGNYVFRHEIIAMHGAGSENGAQNYPQCFNIAITGSGTDNPEGVLGTALYTSTDAGILFNPYETLTSYEIPGPALYGSGSDSGSGSGSDSTPVASSAAAVSTTATPVAAPTSLVTSVIVPTPAATTAAAQSVVPSSTAVAPAATETASSDSSTLPETFTLDTFIEWLKSTAGTTVARRHARALN
ncbi:glycosyl hydrolase family 61-domain-containing protein [Ilyonectria robusta]|uniref:glycosyl hydrolase family 61-domain-containing protein n=1 Tax=Ilyonectria robusta TaxID=1079257 RepID=UPI001E8E86DA|nr:glycosyl hydrolase family 61-domain-containing protein [Ilyonectria robusta]KAH8734291.1 glycosyl hydrolase family 61-domain-containing protein [Ilyonectria robusta]